QLNSTFAAARAGLEKALQQSANATVNPPQELLEAERIRDSLDGAIQLIHQQRFDEAAALLRQVAERQPNNPQAMRSLADIRLAQGHLAEAVDGYTRLLQLTPHDAEARSNLGVALQRQGRWQDAIACYETGVL